MRYMLLIYSQENESASPAERRQVAAGHKALMEETRRRGIFCAADPLAPASTATTVRVQGEKVLFTDGPFVETKEQLAGYILDCQDLDEAIQWRRRSQRLAMALAAWWKFAPSARSRRLRRG